MESRKRAASVIALMAIWQIHASTQQPTFRSATELVSLNVAVTGADAQPIPGLTAEQFVVLEDGVPQQLKFFSPGDMPLDVVILLDTSASMTGSMGLVQQAASRLARALRPADRASVMGISSGLRVLQTFTNDKVAVEAAIKSTKPAGRTPLYASLYTALSELEKNRRAGEAPRRQAIVVLSDGQDTSSTFTFEEILKVVQRHAVAIYTIAPRPTRVTKAMREHLYGETTMRADFELKRLAAETGGRSFFPVTLLEMNGIYDGIASELSHQYALGYQSSNVARDGNFRRIALKISVPGLQWRTRSGYLAERTLGLAGGDE